jgi:hypothetical protein
MLRLLLPHVSHKSIPLKSALVKFTPVQSALALAVGAALFSGLCSSPGQAQVVPSPGPQVGSSNTISADPPVVRPRTQPCTVTLLHEQAFADFNNKSFSYAPPPDCPGLWSKVVLSADFTVTAGRQFDRTTQFYIGNANIFYGTTAEPRATLSPSWHVERDVTDLSAIFKTAQPGQAILGNLVNSTFTSTIFANAELQFYPVSSADPAPTVADVVVPLPNAPGGATTLNTTTSQLAQAVTLPGNTEAAFLDVFAQSQGGDEFWYTCVPNDVATELQSCGNTGFRETEISIDGQPAGVAPVYPWVYTGGVDPFLWEPIPGVQTLNFKPFRVNLTPFAGLLADGKPHTVAISVFNADGFFLTTANLLVFTDHGAQHVTGGVLQNTLSAAPTPRVTEKLATDAQGNITGTVAVGSNRDYVIRGWVETSQGRVETTVEQSMHFRNSQQFDVTTTDFVQDIAQQTTVDATTTIRGGSLNSREQKHYSYPFSFNIDEKFNPDNTITEVNVADQKYLVDEQQSREGFPLFRSETANHVASQDTDLLVPSNGGFSIGSHSNQKSSQSYVFKDSLGHCYSQTLTAANSALAAVEDGAACHGR